MIYPKKIKRGSHIRVIAPSRTFKIISEETRNIALERFEELGIKVSFGKNADRMEDFLSTSVEKRLADLHEAFEDKSIDAIFTAIGGANSNQLIDKIDYKLIKKNPKIFCGFSDITALLHAITTQTGLVTYAGPHFSSFGMQEGFDYTLAYFKKCLMEEAPIELKASEEWSDDLWFLNQADRNFVKNDDYWLINHGKEDKIRGQIWGENLGTLSLLQGTKYFPKLKGSILFIEETADSKDFNFDRLLQSLIMQEGFNKVKAILIGRFQEGSKINRESLTKIITAKKELENISVIANVDFGHTTPIITYPIGGELELSLNPALKLTIIKH